jgi:hypothetical protein
VLQSNDRETPEAWFQAQAAEMALKFEELSGFTASVPPAAECRHHHHGQ